MASSFLASDMVFSGDTTDPYAAEDFISRFNALASAVKWNDAAKVRSVGMLLTGTVKDWFKTQNYTDWDTFCDAFKAFHNRRFSAEAAENALRQRKKLPTETFDAYFYDIIRLLKQANITDVIKQVRWLTKGLNPAMATQLAARKPTTTAAVLDVFHEWEDLQLLMGLDNLHISASTTASEPPYPSQHEQEIQKLRHELHEKDQVISALEAQYGPYHYRGRPPNSRSRSPHRRVRFAQDDDLTITRYYDEDTNPPGTVSASSIFPSTDYDSDDWLPNSTIATAATTTGLIPLIYVYVHGVPLLAMIDTGASNTIISPETVLQLPGPLITEDSPPVFDYSGRRNNTFGCATLEIALHQGSPINIKAIITDHAQHTDIILGTDFCKERGLKIDFESNTIKFNEWTPTEAGIISYQLPCWFRPGLPLQQHPHHENTAAENFDVDTFDKLDNLTTPYPTNTMQFAVNRPTSLKIPPQLSFQLKTPDGNRSPPPSPNPHSTISRRTPPTYTVWLTLTIISISILLGIPGYCTQTFSLPRTTTAITASHAQDAGISSMLGSTTLTGMPYSSIFPNRSHPPECTLSFQHPLALLPYICPRKCKTSGPRSYKTPANPQSIIIRTMAVSELSTIEINLGATYGENPLRSLDLLSSHRTKLRLLVTFIHPSQNGSSPETTSDEHFFSCHGKIAHQHLRGVIHTLEGLYSTRAFASMAIKQPKGWIGGQAIVVAQIHRDDYSARARQQLNAPSPRRHRSPKARSPRRNPPKATSTRHHRSPTAPSTSRHHYPTAPSTHHRSTKAPLVHRQLSPKAPTTSRRQKFPSAPSPSSSSSSSSSSASSSSSPASSPPPPKDRSPHTPEPSLPVVNQPSPPIQSSASPIQQPPKQSITTEAQASPSAGTPIPPTKLPEKAQATFTQVDYLIDGFPEFDFPAKPPAGRGKRRTAHQRSESHDPILPSAPPASTTTTSSTTNRKRTTPSRPPTSRTPKKICSIVVSCTPSTNVPDLSRAVTPPLAPQLTPD